MSSPIYGSLLIDQLTYLTLYNKIILYKQRVSQLTKNFSEPTFNDHVYNSLSFVHILTHSPPIVYP
jgi:hypothetical protein